ncbi:MAG: LysM peptidoglycan-binding domain-containing protein [Candidatus Omnitrophica bacterium]|nr:LysM peptidoglycan-binding domain-containing protein [Candidatus Omnitrophota bacterium]
MRWKAGLVSILVVLFAGIEEGQGLRASEPSGVYHAQLEQARQLEKNGKFLQARKVYENILASKKEVPGLKEAARKKIGQLNVKIVHSKLETPESDLYEVAAGDSLYKIAQRFGTTVALLKRSNGIKSDVIVPGAKLKVLNAPFSMRVDKSDNILTLQLGGRFFKSYRVSTGKNNSTPVGNFKINMKLENPTWYYAGAVVPPGSPDNYLGTRWMGFDLKGYGIHGTTFPESIGKQESLGCVRLLNKDVEELYDLVPVGTSVRIKN